MLKKETGIKLGREHIKIGKAARIPVTPATPIFSVSPVVLSVPGRIVDLQIKVSAPTTGDNLPIILLSHGGGTTHFLSSYNGCAPLVDFWAAHGFVVIQPTHLTSKSLALDPKTPGAPLFEKARVEDMKQILDQLDVIENTIPAIKKRIDRSRVAVAGHSFGGHTASMLLGAEYTDDDGNLVYTPDARVKTGILFAANGIGDEYISAAAAKFSCLRTVGFARMTLPTLVVAGDKDTSHELSTRGAEAHADPYYFSNGSKSLLTVAGGEHMLGGITGYDTVETTDESPERVAIIQRLSLAYLYSAFYPDDRYWDEACAVLQEISELGSVRNKGPFYILRIDASVSNFPVRLDGGVEPDRARWAMKGIEPDRARWAMKGIEPDRVQWTKKGG
jgi:pimeloyl-ACP methyl ester carboxylesterase